MIYFSKIKARDREGIRSWDKQWMKNELDYKKYCNCIDDKNVIDDCSYYVERFNAVNGYSIRWQNELGWRSRLLSFECSLECWRLKWKGWHLLNVDLNKLSLLFGKLCVSSHKFIASTFRDDKLRKVWPHNNLTQSRIMCNFVVSAILKSTLIIPWWSYHCHLEFSHFR